MPHASTPPRPASHDLKPITLGRIVGQTSLQIWSLSSATRLRRQLERAGAVVENGNGTRVVLLRADWVYDEAIVAGLVNAHTDTALVEPDGECVALNVSEARQAEAATDLETGRVPPEVTTVDAAKIAGSYNATLRKREPPYLMRLSTGQLPEIETRIFGGAYKGVTDLVTLYIWPAPARAVTRICAHAGITPNQVTGVGLLLVLLTTWLFWQGHYALGMLAAWPMTFLDTVDGKLARVTLTSSKFGNIFDHGIDLLHPPFWWWAWIVGLSAAGFPIEHSSMVLTVIVAGYVLQRIEEGLFMTCFGMDMHVWQRFDSRFRLITARRNPNLVILTIALLAGRPDLGIVAVAVWTALCLFIHALRLVQAAFVRRQGPLRSWLAS